MKTATEFGSLWIWAAVDFCFHAILPSLGTGHWQVTTEEL